MLLTLIDKQTPAGD